MKKIAIIALSFVLSATMMTACRRNSSGETSESSTAATTKPTTTHTTVATVPTTAPTTASTHPSSSGMLEDGVVDGNGDAGKSGRVGRRP